MRVRSPSPAPRCSGPGQTDSPATPPDRRRPRSALAGQLRARWVVVIGPVGVLLLRRLGQLAVDAGSDRLARSPVGVQVDQRGPHAAVAHSTQKTTYASPTTARPTSDATTATEVIRLACLSSHSSASDTSGCRATARRRSPTIPRNRHPMRIATPKNTSAGTISRRAPQPAELLA
jgi:hypothetical protein